jgi:dTDP-4-dehydrorhamnose reductase
MKVLLLGANGQLGTDIAAENERRGIFQIFPVTRDVVDLNDAGRATEKLSSLDFDVMINCTGYHRTDEAESNEARAVAVNTRAVGELAAICARKKARFIHVSTDYVFGGGEDRSPLAEDARKSPLNVYGRTKSEGEDLALASHEDTLVVRVASLFGVAGASGKGGNFVETMIRLGREKGRLRVVNDQRMSPTGTRDAAGAMLALIEKRASPGIYHVVNDGVASWCDFARRIIARANVPAEVEGISTAEFPTPARRPPYSALDNRKAVSIAGKMAPWEEALDRYLASKGYRA